MSTPTARARAEQLAKAASALNLTERYRAILAYADEIRREERARLSNFVALQKVHGLVPAMKLQQFLADQADGTEE